MMIQGILIIFCVNLTTDSLLTENQFSKKTYSTKIVVNGFLSAGLGITAGISHTKGNAAYTDYQNSTTIAEAHDNWNRTKLYDNVRNVCTAGAVFFAARTLHYYVKHKRAKKTANSVPFINFQYVDVSKWVIYIQKKL